MAKREDWINNKRKNFENNLSNIVTSVVKPIIKSKSKFETELILNWEKIIGEGFARKVDFKKVRPLVKGKKNYCLYISVKHRDSLEISHSRGLIAERINSYFGYNAIKEIAISNDKKTSSEKKSGLSYLATKHPSSDCSSKKDYGLDDEGLIKTLRNIERNLGEKND